MYSKGPGSVHHSVLHYGEQLPKKAVSVVDLIMLQGTRADPRHAMAGRPTSYKCCAMKARAPGERRLITKIQLLHVHNDCDVTLRFVVRTQLAAGCVMVVPARFAGSITAADDRVVYQPRFVHLTGLPIMHYVGLERRILSETRTWVGTAQIMAGNSEYRAYTATDPLMVFMLQHRDLFEELSADDMRIASSKPPESSGKTVYLVKQALVQRVQRFFRDAVMPLIEYMPPTGEAGGEEWLEIELENNAEIGGGFVGLQIQLDYIAVFDAPDDWEWPCQTIKVTNLYFFLVAPTYPC